MRRGAIGHEVVASRANSRMASRIVLDVTKGLQWVSFQEDEGSKGGGRWRHRNLAVPGVEEMARTSMSRLD